MDATVLSLESGNSTTGEEEKQDMCCNKLMDMKEAKKQVLLAVPMILTNAFYYMIFLVSVMFAGHIGRLQLAGATLANAWAIVTGLAVMIGLSGALETLCGQGYGANLYRTLGIHLQASCIVSFMFSIIISIIWFYSESILILLHQNPEISKATALYLKYLIPGLFAFGFLQNILRFLQTQSVVVPLVAFSGIPLCVHVTIAYALVHHTSFGYRGAPLAASISLWISTLGLIIYVTLSKKFEQTWCGLSSQSFVYIPGNLKLALPSAAMVCLEFWAYEILVILAGLMPNPKLTTSVVAICVNTESFTAMITFGLMAAVSTRVSNELGACNIVKAKHAMVVTLKLAVLLLLVTLLAVVLGHKIWAGFFTNSSDVIRGFVSMIPLLAISISLDSIQGIFSGVARGCGWQHLAVIANLTAFYLIGLPIEILLAFKLKLHAKGLWIGLICGLLCQTAALLLIASCRKWKRTQLLEDGSSPAH